MPAARGGPAAGPGPEVNGGGALAGPHLRAGRGLGGHAPAPRNPEGMRALTARWVFLKTARKYTSR